MVDVVPSDTFICGQCQHNCDTLITFIKHRAIHEDLHGDYRCELCFGEFSSKSTVLEHYTSHHKVSLEDGDTPTNEEGPYEIVEVGETDGKMIAVVLDPDPEHTDDEPESITELLRMKKLPDHATDEYLRDVVNYKFALETLPIHGPKFSYGRSLYRCLFCLFQANEVNILSRHMFDSHKCFLNNLKPSKYEKTFLEQSKKDGKAYDGQIISLTKYRTFVQPEVKRQSVRLKIKQKCCKQKLETFPCETCGKEFKQRRLRRVHMETHRTEKNFLCDECGKAFKSRNRLTAHRRSHREKIFKCLQCDFQSKLHSAIHGHRQVHSQGCVLCHICGSAYTDRSTLTKHMSVHSMDRPYPCAFAGCTWRFKTEALCKAHYRSHTTKGRFKCDICNYHFRHKHHLQRHLTRVHAMEILKHHQLRTEMEMMPANDEPTAVPIESEANDMQMIQVVLNQQVQQEVVTTSPQCFDIIVNMPL